MQQGKKSKVKGLLRSLQGAQEMYKHGVQMYKTRLSRVKTVQNPEVWYKINFEVHKSVEQPINISFSLQSQLCLVIS